LIINEQTVTKEKLLKIIEIINNISKIEDNKITKIICVTKPDKYDSAIINKNYCFDVKYNDGILGFGKSIDIVNSF
jgi:hypothetical protein